MKEQPDRTSRPADRRSRRTRVLLGEALVALLLEHRYDAITVQEISDRANVGRSTFYAHFLDKDDLLLYQFDTLLAALNSHMDHSAGGGNRMIPSLALLRHVAEHQRLYRALVRGRVFDPVLTRMQGALSRQVEDQLTRLLPPGHASAVPLPLVAQFVAGALLTLLQWWLAGDFQCSPEQLNADFEQLIRPSVRAAVGVEI